MSEEPQGRLKAGCEFWRDRELAECSHSNGIHLPSLAVAPAVPGQLSHPASGVTQTRSPLRFHPGVYRQRELPTRRGQLRGRQACQSLRDLRTGI